MTYLTKKKTPFRFVSAMILMSHVATVPAASLSLSRIALTFEDQKSATIVERDGKLVAQAEISFNGNGLLRGAWEVAGPNPDGSSPQFRKVANVQRPLGGREAVILKSPPLPTESNGLYLIRLLVTEPATALEPPVIRYNVNEKQAAQEPR